MKMTTSSSVDSASSAKIGFQVAECPLYEKEREMYMNELAKIKRKVQRDVEVWGNQEKNYSYIWVYEVTCIGGEVIRYDS